MERDPLQARPNPTGTSHEEGQPIHYDLHAWLYVDNPDGTVTMWNPDVTCPPQEEG